MTIFNKQMNVHNHTYWSDGDNTPEEIINSSKSLGMDVVGISDHLDDRKGYKLTLLNLHQYYNEIKLLSTQFEIEVLCGVEIDVQFLLKASKDLLYKACNQLDFVLIEDIEFLANSLKLEDLDNYIKQFTCSVGLAHTNILRLSEKYTSIGGLHYVIDFIKRNNLFWEINASNVYYYFDNIICRNLHPEEILMLSEIKKAGIKVTVGSDTHSLENLEKGRLFAANEIAREMNMG